MTAKVFTFKKKSATAEVSSLVAPAAPKRLITLTEIFNDCYEDVIAAWRDAATKNRLREFVEARLPKIARSAVAGADYVNDLNVIAAVERRLEMKVSIFYPGCVPHSTYGWMAAFHRGQDTFTTPSDMASEANARVLNVLLCLALEQQLKQLGRN